MTAGRSGIVLGGGLVLAMALLALLGPLVLPYDPAAQLLEERLMGPSMAHPLGLDELGRDILARLALGGRLSLLLGFAVVSLSSVVGVALGAVSGYVGGWVDSVLGRLMDVLLAFPGFLLAMAIVSVLGPGTGNLIAALSVVGWVSYARLVRGQVLRTRELNFVMAARAIGAGPWRILVKHVVPTVLPLVAVQATLGLAGIIIAEASLSFLGLGVQPPTPSWGSMLDAGRVHMLDAPHLTVFPGLAIASLVFGLNLLGDSVRDRVAASSGE